MVPLLRDYFDCILIDLLGLGASGRPRYDTWEHDAALAYHTDAIKAWWDKVIPNQPVYLLGHSFGG